VKLDAGRHCWRKASTSIPRNEPPIQNDNRRQDAGQHLPVIRPHGPPLRRRWWIAVDLCVGHKVGNHRNAYDPECCDGSTAEHVSFDWWVESNLMTPGWY